ncbi:MAG: hypothetical protein KDD62_07665 [Bdellovibrionales bacterium]|nr:hypothetical protein [Bdellovibrionales bacterium]
MSLQVSNGISNGTRPEVLVGPLVLTAGKIDITVEYLSTTNPNKLKELRAAGLELEGITIEPDELQLRTEQRVKMASNDIKAWKQVAVEIAIDKANRAYQIHQSPVLVEDASLVVRAAPGMTGPNIKNSLLPGREEEGLLDLCAICMRKEDRMAVAFSTLAAANSRGAGAWVGMVIGQIADRPRGENGFGWDKIFIPEPSIQLLEHSAPFARTYAEMTFEEKTRLFPLRGLAVDDLRNAANPRS